MKIFLSFILILFLAACASTSVQKIGSSTYVALPPGSEVLVFTKDDQVKHPFDVIGEISYTNPGKFQILTLEAAIEPLKAKARAVGGNGIIIDKSVPIKSGFISTGVYAEARAIRIK